MLAQNSTAVRGESVLWTLFFLYTAISSLGPYIPSQGWLNSVKSDLGSLVLKVFNTHPIILTHSTVSLLYSPKVGLYDIITPKSLPHLFLMITPVPILHSVLDLISPILPQWWNWYFPLINKMLCLEAHWKIWLIIYRRFSVFSFDEIAILILVS